MSAPLSTQYSISQWQWQSHSHSQSYSHSQSQSQIAMNVWHRSRNESLASWLSTEAGCLPNRSEMCTESTRCQPKRDVYRSEMSTQLDVYRNERDLPNTRCLPKREGSALQTPPLETMMPPVLHSHSGAAPSLRSLRSTAVPYALPLPSASSSPPLSSIPHSSPLLSSTLLYNLL